MALENMYVLRNLIYFCTSVVKMQSFYDSNDTKTYLRKYSETRDHDI